MFRLQTSANFGPGVVTLDELNARVRAVVTNLATAPAPAEESFGAAITKATRRLVHPAAEATFEANEGGFGEQIKKAAEKDPRSRQSAAERAKKERSRYHKRGERRKPTRSG